MTGSVLGNDFNPDRVSSTVAWTSSAPGFTGDATGGFSFYPPDIVAFMTGSGPVNVNYTSTDQNGFTASATVTISPKVLQPGEGASGFGMGVVNGGPQVGGKLLAYPDSGTLKLIPLDPAAYVVGAGGSGIVQWSGGVPSLYLTSNGMDVAPLGGIGHLVVNAGLGASVLGVTGVGDLEIGASGNVGPVSGVGRVIRINAGGTVGPVSATGDVVAISGSTVLSVTTGGRIGSVESSGDILGTVAGSDVYSVHAHGTLMGSVQATGSIYSVQATNDIVGNVGANGFVGRVHSQSGSINGMVSAGQGDVYEVSAPLGSITNAVLASNGSIYWVRAGQDITQTVSAFVDVWSVEAGHDVLLDVTAVMGDISRVYAGDDLIGNVTAMGTVWGVVAMDDLLGDVKSTGGSIGTIEASDILSNRIEANIGEERAERKGRRGKGERKGVRSNTVRHVICASHCD